MRKKDLEIIAAVMDGRISLRPFFEKLPWGAVVANHQGEIIFYNEAQGRRDGLRPEDVVGQRLEKVYGPAGGPSGQASATPLVMNGRAVGTLYVTADEPPQAAEPKAGARQIQPGQGFDGLIGRAENFLRAVNLGRSAAGSPSPVMLCGETGTGKEMFARNIHEHSSRFGRPFVAINCAAIPQDLLEGLLFGTARGAFTGAADKPGLFEEANRGTVFLDELDSMPLKLQPKLLRVLQDRKVRRVGSPRETGLDVKIISAISGSPEEAVRHGRLRPDLFYRLGVVLISLPPLRQRPDDLPLLAAHFIEKHNAVLGRRVSGLSGEVLEAFQAYGWPGNVRELEHIIEAVLNMAGERRLITPDMLPDHFSLSPRVTLGRYAPLEDGRLQDFPLPSGGQSATLKDQERAVIGQALTVTSGNVAKAARMLGISRQLLVYKMKKHGLERGVYLG